MPTLLLETEASYPMLGNILNGRYQIVEILNAGALEATYIAEDTSLPDKPKCIIKHRRSASNDPDFLQIVGSLFVNEAETLEALGKHDQIPQLIEYFESNQEFYWVQEFIEGHPLNEYLPASTRSSLRWTEVQVIQLLQEVLGILEFVHAQSIIHGNLQPNSIITRASDGRLFLTDFDTAQLIQPRSPDETDSLPVTFDHSPAGYISAEQLASHPRPNSDIFALGTIAVQALTGLHPAQLQADVEGRNWQQEVSVSEELAAVINQMAEYNPNHRYQTVSEVIQALQQAAAIIQARKDSHQEPSYSVAVEVVNDFAITEPISLESRPWVAQRQPEEQEQTNNTFSYLFVSPSPLLPLPPLEAPLVESNTSPLVPVSPRRKVTVSPTLVTFSLGMAANAFVMVAGLFYMFQPDPSRFKTVEQFINEKQLLAGAEKVCQVPHICFWQKTKASTTQAVKPLSQEESHRLLQNAYNQAQMGYFTKAVESLKQITPGSPRYAIAQSKLAEYQKFMCTNDTPASVAVSAKAH